MSVLQGKTGCVFNIQQFSVHDGPGIRTIVFLSGCPLRCRWCCNPESQICAPQLAFNPRKCIGAGPCADACFRACTPGAIGAHERTILIDRQQCTNCGECAIACPSKALEMLGRYMTVDDVTSAVERDSCFYSRSGGGLTVSGGEPLSQPEFTIALLRAAKAAGMSTAIESSGYGKWEHLETICQQTDSVFYDIKSIDPDKHTLWTGVSNEVILENFKLLARRYPELPIIVRTPVIPSFNDTPDEIGAIIGFVNRFSRATYELMPYHAFGESKYTFLGRRYPMTDASPVASDKMAMLRRVATRS